jgi:hypothetical protein
VNHLVIQGSCLALQPAQLPPGSVMIADPPYSAHVHENSEANIGASAQVGVRKRSLGFDPLTPELRNHIAALGARCRWSVVFCDGEGIAAWKDAFNAQPGYRYLRWIPWVRWSSPQRTADRPPSCAEAIVLAGPKAAIHWNGPGNLRKFDEELAELDEFDELCERGKDKHTTAKPLDLLLRLVEYFSDPGELIFDPTAGRSTALLAAKLLGRSGLGLELQASEVDFGRARLANPLSPRDAERLRRYQERHALEAADAVRRAANTDQVKARNAARKARVA